MNYYQERVETDSQVLAKIYIGKSQSGNCHYPLHWHNNLEFDLVLQGTIIGKINGKLTEVPEGDFLFINSGDLHETDAVDKNRMCAITVLLSYSLIKEYFPEAHKYYYDFTGKENAKEQVKALILECADLFQEKKEFYELGLSIALRKICLVLLKDCRKKKQDIGSGMYEPKIIQKVKGVIEYLENNYQEEISLKDAAAEAGMAPTYYSKFIRRTTGDTFYGYLTKIRLYHAYMELINTDDTILEIALNNGFYNVKSFIDIFKEVYVLTPEKYRKQYIEGLENKLHEI